MTGVTYDNASTPNYTYEYDANGRAALVRDRALNREFQTEYDLSGRPMGTQIRNSGNLAYRTMLNYDGQNRLIGFGEGVGSRFYKTDYSYNDDNQVEQIGYGGAYKLKYTYDDLGRVVTRTSESGVDAGKLTSTYGYVAGGHGANSTTPLVASITQPGMNFSYTYDSRGNIISETRNGMTTTYEYDPLGQLTRVNDPHENATWDYNYDRGGNIISKAKYAYTTGGLGVSNQVTNYDYSDSNWGDKLTAFGDKTITYDAIGNPLNDGTWSYTWSAGRQLKQMSKTGTTVQFKYDHNGMRTQKIVTQNGATTTMNYTLHGKLIAHMTCGSNTMHFFYDAQSRPTFVEYNGTMYRYVHNLQGDIVGIVDANGSIVVEYKYDAWGRPLLTTGTLKTTLGELNPFRYRGYVYDEETGLYYLRDRYYSPLVNRFINCDIIIKTIRLKGANLFAYCENDPEDRSDESGNYDTASVPASLQAVDPIPERVVTVFDEYGIGFPEGYYYNGCVDRGDYVRVSFDKLVIADNVITTEHKDYYFFRQNSVVEDMKNVMVKLQLIKDSISNLKDKADYFSDGSDILRSYKSGGYKGALATASQIISKAIVVDFAEYICKQCVKEIFSSVRIDSWKSTTRYNSSGKVYSANVTQPRPEYLW